MSFIRSLFRCFITGIITLLPFIVTVGLVGWSSGFLISFLGPETQFGKMLTTLGVQSNQSGWAAYVLGWLMVLGLIFIVGVICEIGLRNFLERSLNALVKRIPIIGSIYGTTEQLTKLMKNESNNDMKNMSPVYCRFGKTLILALMPTAEELILDGHCYRVAIIPTAPIPFGGAVFLIPSEDVLPGDMSVEALLQFYVSMGVSAPNIIPKAEPKVKMDEKNVIKGEIEE